MTARDRPAPRVRMCAGGPMLVHGPISIESEDGVVHESTRPVSAVCRCGATSRAPWCDGTHRLLPEKSRP
ncbi:CDGSH iron-sulfur domain-containing protein [Nocardioides sp. 1609]|uniref:CDGSH iron-sulfur domain-containing protein n=1 Tax=Nocardioides sp. 1609 TaxID=2508327 RepID=UPI001FD66694|nr:CDGSH iron-sulfur domain-containing protein [Nocardioides sp. 1609]